MNDKDKEDYIKNTFRIGTEYYQKEEKPNSHKKMITNLKKWNYTNIKDDLKDLACKIVKYKGHCYVPNHINYEQVIPPVTNPDQILQGHYNFYHKISHTAEEGDYTFSKLFMEHIFGEQIELGYDYMKNLYLNPLQKGPILCLVSSENMRGKSTFLYWLKQIFENNSVILSSANFSSKFNSDLEGKLLICTEECHLTRESDTELLKNLSTGDYFNFEKKGVDRSESDFFGKIILCSNFETSFVKIKNHETRFWVRRLDEYSEAFQSHLLHLKEKLVEEIPAFLNYLKTRQYSTKNESRMWFRPELLETEALRRLKKAGISRPQKELVGLIELLMDELNIDSIHFDHKGLVDLSFLNNIRVTSEEIKSILKERWDLRPTNNSNSFTRHQIDKRRKVVSKKVKGRFYTITREHISNFLDDFDE
jgi:hypothetical protein